MTHINSTFQSHAPVLMWHCRVSQMFVCCLTVLRDDSIIVTFAFDYTRSARLAKWVAGRQFTTLFCITLESYFVPFTVLLFLHKPGALWYFSVSPCFFFLQGFQHMVLWPGRKKKCGKPICVENTEVLTPGLCLTQRLCVLLRFVLRGRAATLYWAES